MTQKKIPKPKPTLGEVKEQFKTWRRIRKSPQPMPEKLWEAAVILSTNHSISQISEELIVDHDDLKKACTKRTKNRKRVRPPTFIELEYEPPVAISECIVELEDSRGAKMRMHFRGKTDFDLLELGKAFWRKRP